MEEVVTASPGEDSPLLNTEADTVYLPVTVSGGNAEVIAGSDTGEENVSFSLLQNVIPFP